MKLKVTHYVKKKGERAYSKMSTSQIKDSSIDDYLVFFPTSALKKKPDREVKARFSDYGTKYKRIVKNKRTGNSTMLVLEEYY